jgi:hypothetical protein
LQGKFEKGPVKSDAQQAASCDRSKTRSPRAAALGIMRQLLFIALLAGQSCGVSWSCTPITYIDDSGHELSEEKIVQIKFDNHAYVIVGDVVTLENITANEISTSGRKRPHVHQRATVLVRKSWKPSKRVGDELQIYTDLGDSCSESLELSSQVLIYAGGAEPVELSGWGTTSALGFSSSDVRILDSIASLADNKSEPNKPLQPIAAKDGAPVER